jgi:hypothetical protein
VIVLEMTDDRLDSRATPEVAFNGIGQATLLSGDVDPELVIRWRVLTAVALVGDKAPDRSAGLALYVGDEGLPGSALTWVTNYPPAEWLSVVATETLVLNPYGRCALPLEMSRGPQPRAFL